MSDQRALVGASPLRVTVLMVLLQVLALGVLGVLELATLDAKRLAMGLSTAGFFLLAGVGLGLAARALRQGHSWARSPVVLAQLITLGVAWSFRGGSTTWVSLALAVVSLLALYGVFHPRSLAALSDSDRTDR